MPPIEKKTLMFLRLLLSAALLAAILACLAFANPIPYVKAILERIAELGCYGPLLLVGVYAIAGLLFLPGAPLSLAAGFLFGATVGTLAASVGSTLGASAAFLIARFLLRDKIAQRLTTHPKFLLLDRAIDEQGLQIVLLIRLCGLLPFGPMSYVLGLTGVPTGRYVLATFLGRLPSTIALAYVGSTAKSIADAIAGNVRFGLEQKLLFAFQGLAVIAVFVVIVRIARKTLRSAIDDPS